jgi:hypothetical protein
MAAAFKEMTKTHNEMYNPTGVPLKPKRASKAPLGATVESRAVALPAASATKDALAAKGDLASILGTQPNYELLVCRDGHLWVHALNDGVLSDQLPLCGCGNYQYVLGQEADQVSQGDGAISIYSQECDANAASCSHPAIATLRAFHVMAGLVVTAVDRGATWYPIAISDDQWTAVFEVDSTCAITEKFQQTPCPWMPVI